MLEQYQLFSIGIRFYSLWPKWALGVNTAGNIDLRSYGSSCWSNGLLLKCLISNPLGVVAGAISVGWALVMLGYASSHLKC